MGKRGPKPKTKEQKALKGNPGKRSLDEAPPEQDISFGSLRLPQKLAVPERVVWNDLMNAFPDWYFTPADKHLLVAYCRAVVRIDKSEKALSNTSVIAKRGNGGACLSPHFKVISDSLAQMTRLADLLGLTRDRRRVAGFGGEIPPVAPKPPDPGGEEVGDIPDDLIGRPRLVQNG